MTVVELNVKVVGSGSETLSLRVEDFESATVRSLKALVERQDAVRFPVAAQRLIFQGQILQDDKLLSAYQMATGMAVHLTITPGAVATAAATPVTASPTPAVPNSVGVVRQCLQAMRLEPGFDVALQTLQKICANIVGHPAEEKYRKLRVANAALRTRLFDRTRAMECVQALGFQEGVEEGFLVLVPTAERWENLQACKRVVDEFASSSGASSASSSASSSPSPFGGFGGMGAPAMGGFGAGNGDAAQMMAQAQAMLQNPMMAQMVANSPMMQQMAQSNPMMARMMQDPAMLAQAMQAMQQDPTTMQQMQQMMQNPQAMQQMQQMMRGGAGFGGGGFGSSMAGTSPFGSAAPAGNPFAPAPAATAPSPFAPAAPAATTPSPAPASAPSSAPASTPASTTSEPLGYDEEEIAAAIARSLEEDNANP